MTRMADCPHGRVRAVCPDCTLPVARDPRYRDGPEVEALPDYETDGKTPPSSRRRSLWDIDPAAAMDRHEWLTGGELGRYEAGEPKLVLFVADDGEHERSDQIQRWEREREHDD